MVDEIALATGTTVIADLHLDVGEPRLVESFVRHLESAASTPRLLVLGDLFDAWVGPAQARMPGAPPVIEALRALTRRGTPVDVVPGNRDFLLDASFEAATGARLHADGFVGVFRGARTRFVHGDTLCTLDTGYQRLRRVLRSRPVTWLAPRVPLVVGAAVARRLRRASTRAVANKPSEEKSIQRDAVVSEARAFDCGTLICGHAHEFRDERPAADVRWIVVDAFGGARDVLTLTAEGDWAPSSSRSSG